MINNKSEWGMNCLVRQETAFDREVRTANTETEGNSKTTPDPGSETVIVQTNSKFQTQFRQRKKQARIEKSSRGQLTDSEEVRSRVTNLFSMFDHGGDRTVGNNKKRKM